MDTVPVLGCYICSFFFVHNAKINFLPAVVFVSEYNAIVGFLQL